MELGAGRLLEQSAERLQRAVERDLDGVRLQADELADLAGGQVGAVAERDQLAVALAERRHRPAKVEPRRRVGIELSRRDLIGHLGDGERLRTEVLADLSSGDPDQPRSRFTLAGVEAVAVAERAFDRRRGDVLGVGAVADPVGDVRVDAADQRLGVGERIAPGHPITLM